MGGKSVFVNMNVYGNCLEGEFKNYYDLYFEDVKADMISKGFEWNEEEKRFEHH